VGERREKGEREFGAREGGWKGARGEGGSDGRVGLEWGRGREGGESGGLGGV